MTAQYSAKHSCGALASALVLTALPGCGTAPQYTRVHVPMAVECREQEPQRPTMPTEALAPGVAPWALLRAALGEIDRREAYEVQLRTALRACTMPIVQPRHDLAPEGTPKGAHP